MRTISFLREKACFLYVFSDFVGAFLKIRFLFFSLENMQKISFLSLKHELFHEKDNDYIKYHFANVYISVFYLTL